MMKIISNNEYSYSITGTKLSLWHHRTIKNINMKPLNNYRKSDSKILLMKLTEKLKNQEDNHKRET